MADKVLKKQIKDVPIITICIPTYNRGDRLLSEIKGYLSIDERWPILILNNGSNKTCEYYEEIRIFARLTTILITTSRTQRLIARKPDFHV